MSACPKCGAVLRRDVIVTAERGDEFSAEAAYWYTCWRCGKLVVIETAPVKPMPPPVPDDVIPARRPSSESMQAVEEWLESIINERKKKTSWVAICKMISIATGHKYRYAAIQRNFKKLVYNDRPELRKLC